MKKILFLSHHNMPHVGGVERHIEGITESLVKKGYVIKTVSSEDIKYPKIKVLGLLYIWYWLFKNRKLITSSDTVHIHDVFIWYLPFKFIFPNKKVFITLHGWEGKYPPTIWSILNKKVANYLCNGSIAVGKYIEKYYRIKADYIIHGAVTKSLQTTNNKLPNTVVYLGRKDKDTGYLEFKKWLEKHPELKVKYLTNEPNPQKYLRTSEYCVPTGYLSYLEAKNYGCKIITFVNNPLKKDYWQEIKKLNSIPVWDEVANIYTKLWGKV